MSQEVNSNTFIKGISFITLSLIFIVTLIYQYYRVQVLEAENYKAFSTNNIVRQNTIYPIRGDIYDINNETIVDNRPAFSLYVTPRIVKNDTILQHKLIQIIEDSVVNFDRIFRRRYADSESVLLKRHISPELMAKIIENKDNLPGVFIQSDPKRNHASHMNATHILGYVSEINDKELKQMDKYRAGDIIGKNGIEKSYDKELYGKKGLTSKIYDALGNEVSDLGDNLSYHIDEKDGFDLYTTIDSKVQFVAESLMVNRIGSIVMLDVRNGGVIAMASAPTYDPELRTKTIPIDVWNELIDPKNNKPLLNRSIQGLYPPGSTYKMIAALTALNENLVDKDWKVLCEGALKIGNKYIKCWNHKGHGEVKMTQAIRSSCNIYFYKLGLKIGLDNWEEYSKTFLFGQKTGIDIPLENHGLVPSKAYYEKKYEYGYSQGHLAILAIGQGELLVTPLQVAQYTMIIANEGNYFKPHFVRGYSEKYKNNIQTILYEQRRINKEFKPEHWSLIKTGMFNAVNAKYGTTARLARLPDISVSGKTGTAQVPPKLPHSWFIGFAPSENPEIAITVLVENGGSGGGTATPIARQIMEQYFYGKILKYRPIKPDTTTMEILEIPDLVVPKIDSLINFKIEREIID